MKRILLATVAFVAMTATASANLCEDTQIGHALKTYDDRCEGNLTAAGNSMKNGAGFCNSVLEVTFQDMISSEDLQSDDDNLDDNGELAQVCSAAEDMILKYGTDNDVVLIEGTLGGE